MAVSAFTKISQLVSVRELYTDLQHPVRSDMTEGEAADAIDHFGYGDGVRVSLVLEEGRPVGWTQYSDLRYESYAPTDSVRQTMSAIEIDRVITSNTAAWTAVQVLAERRHEFLFVLDGADVIGTVSLRDFSKPAFKVCLIALTLELEQRALRLCLRDAEASWLALDPQRRKGVRKLYQKKLAETHPESPTPDQEKLLEATNYELVSKPAWALEHTYFCDKKDIITNLQLLPSVDPTVLDETFAAAQRVRNACVHPESSDELYVFEDARELWSFIRSCHNLLAEIEKAVPSDGGR